MVRPARPTAMRARVAGTVAKTRTSPAAGRSHAAKAVSDTTPLPAVAAAVAVAAAPEAATAADGEARGHAGVPAARKARVPYSDGSVMAQSPSWKAPATTTSSDPTAPAHRHVSIIGTHMGPGGVGGDEVMAVKQGRQRTAAVGAEGEEKDARDFVECQYAPAQRDAEDGHKVTAAPSECARPRPPARREEEQRRCEQERRRQRPAVHSNSEGHADAKRHHRGHVVHGTQHRRVRHARRAAHLHPSTRHPLSVCVCDGAPMRLGRGVRFVGGAGLCPRRCGQRRRPPADRAGPTAP
jgi:hypothetical protein